MQQQSKRRHSVAASAAESEHQLIECTTCGPLGVCANDTHAEAIARIHEEFTAVLIDALGIDR